MLGFGELAFQSARSSRKACEDCHELNREVSTLHALLRCLQRRETFILCQSAEDSRIVNMHNYGS